MTIDLSQLANKTAKAQSGLIISDHSIDMKSYTEPVLTITGKGTRGLVFRNPKGIIQFSGVTIDNAGTGVVIKLDGVYNGVKLDGMGTTKLFGKAGNNQSQMIYCQGRWSNVEICGFESDQRRDSRTGSTVTGANCQLAGVLDPNHNLGKVWIHDMIFRNSGDEAKYCNHFERGTGYARGEELVVEDCESYSSGRDVFQQWGFKSVTYRRCRGFDAGKEADTNHWSGISQNGWCEELLIEDCAFGNVAQLIYSGAPEPGKHTYATLRNVKYDQGTHAGIRANSACYLKGPGKYTFEYCSINAPAAKYAGISMDNGAEVFLLADTNKIIAPDIDRFGTVQYFTPPPTTEKRTEELTVVETRDYTGAVIETKYYLGDHELIIKP